MYSTLSYIYENLKPVAALLLLIIALGGCDYAAYYPDDRDNSRDDLPRTEVPRPPVAIPGEIAERDLAITRRMGESFHHSIEEVDYLLGRFDRARTQEDLKVLFNASLLAINHLHDRTDKEALLERVYIKYKQTNPIGHTNPISDIGDIGVNDCLIDFNTPSILDGFDEDAEFTFTLPEYRWWEQPCGLGRMVVESTFYNHYHLGYEDPDVDLCINISGDFSDEGFGRPDPGNPGECDRVNPIFEPRDIAVHWGNDILVLRRLNDSNEPMVFNFNGFTNLLNEPVKVRYKTAGGDWFSWTALPGLTNWDLSSFANSVLEVHISHSGAQPSCGPDWIAVPGGECENEIGPFSVDNFKISI